jgi:hypothetical protein
MGWFLKYIDDIIKKPSRLEYETVFNNFENEFSNRFISSL